MDSYKIPAAAFLKGGGNGTLPGGILMQNTIYPIGLSTCGNKPLDEQSLIELKESGIDFIELSNQIYDDFDFEMIQKTAQRHGISVWSLHLPFAPFDQLDPSALDTDKRQYTLNFMKALILRGSAAGIDKFVIHPSIEPIDDQIRKAKLDASASFLGELADFADTFGAVIAVENLPRTCLGKNSAEILRLTAANDKLRVCFDTNHLLGEDIPTFIRNVGRKIITTHVSDYDFVNERHWLPGEGKADWSAVYNTLQEVGYEGVWLYEVGFAPEKSISRRLLTCKDFVENARSIFRGETPDAIGKPIENLGFWA